MFVCLSTERIHRGGMIILCGVRVLYISNIHVQGNKLSLYGSTVRRVVGNAGGGFSLMCLRVKCCLCMQKYKISSQIFKMQYVVDCMILGFSVIQSSHLVHRPLYFLILTIIFHVVWGLLTPFFQYPYDIR